MIELYRPANCSVCPDIESTLKELAVAHKIIIVEPGQRSDTLVADTSLPAIKEGGKFISGTEAITTYLRELENFVADWRRFQSDACYMDKDGETC
jgi:glutaredoxin